MARRCSVVGCDNEYLTSGLCAMHKGRLERHGNPEYQSPDIKELFMRHINKHENGCWLWTGGQGRGYGRFRIGDKLVVASRASFVLFKNEELTKKLVCHHCDNPLCVNPEHLFQGTIQDNVDDKMKKGRHKTLHGIEQKNAKLNDDAVRQIKNGIMSRSKMAMHFDVSLSLIKAIRAGKRWKHVV